MSNSDVNFLKNGKFCITINPYVKRIKETRTWLWMLYR